MLRFAVALALIVCTSFTAEAADWNQWRGPDRDGVANVSPPLREALPDAGLKPIWMNTQDLPEAKSGGWSSPVVADGRVYVFAHSKKQLSEPGPKKFPWLPPEKRVGMSDEEYQAYEVKRRDEDEARAKAYEYKEIVYCLDAESGKLLWTNEQDSVYTRFAQSSSPAVIEGRLYVLGAGRVARCIDAASGKDLWDRQLPGEFRDEYLQSSFAVADGVAVVLCGALFGLDARTGDVLWENNDDESRTLHSSPAIYQAGDRQLIIANIPGGETICVNPKDGRTLWRVESQAGHSTPLVVGDKLLTYGSSRKAGLRCFQLSPEGAEELWICQRVADPGSSPVVVDGNVYVQGERRLACVDLATGDQMWMTDLDISNPRYTSLVAADGKVLYAFEGVLCFSADPQEYKQLMNARIDADGLLAEETAFRRQLNMDELEKTAEGQKEAEQLWRKTFNNAGPLPCASPAIVDGRIYVRLKNGVACYDLRK
ncbi:MAG: PQQ-like beta-propeller repeat protein [Pirellulaceae bacterium]